MQDVKKIVIFDDDEDIAAILTYIMQEEGWQVTSFSDCNDPVEKVGAIKPDLIMMDNWIPDSGGITATRLLKNNPLLKHIPVIFFSANSDLPSLALQAGADSWLAKPFDITDLEKAIQSAIK